MNSLREFVIEEKFHVCGLFSLVKTFTGSLSCLSDFARNSSRLWRILANGRMGRIM